MPASRTADPEHFDLALAAAEIGTWEWDLVTGRVTWSENFEPLHGFARGAFGSSIETYQHNIHPEDRARVVGALRRCSEGGSDYSVEYRLVTPEGFTRHVEAHGRLLLDENDRPARLIGVCMDITERIDLLENERRARHDAETSELHYRTLAEAIPQQVWTARPDGALDFVNQRVTEYFGRTHDEVIGAGWQNVIHPTDLRAVLERWTRSLSTGVEYEVEFRLRRHDGSYRWHLGRAIPMRDAEGAIVRWLGTNTDIDERKRSLALMTTQVEVAQLLVSARTLDAVANAILETICVNLGWTYAQLWVVDRAAAVLRRTAGWCGADVDRDHIERIATFDRMELGIGLPGRIWETQQPMWIVDVQVDGNFPRAPLFAAANLRSALGFPLIVGGEVSAIVELFSIEPRPLEESMMSMTATFGTQIAQFIERQAAENERNDVLIKLRRLQSVTDVALAHLSLGDLLDNLLGRICDFVSCDIGVVMLLDTQKDELYPVATFGTAAELPRDLRIAVGESLSGQAAAERTTKSVRHATEQTFIRPEMRALGLESVTAVPLIAHGRLIGVLIIGSVADREFQRDELEFAERVAERLAHAIDNSSLYENAREANRVKDRFISIASHELKTPMTGILGWTAILKTETDPEVRAEALTWIEQSARAQARLIEDFLDLTRIREGKLVLRMETIDLLSVLTGALRVMASVAAERNVTLDSTVPDAPVRVFGDPARLQQVISNLLGNAIKFTPPGTRVCTSISSDDVHATIAVTDEGAGISADFLPHIFNAFEQDEIGRKAGGLGLGLHIVSTIVKMHSGTITARNADNGGATFVVTLPIAQ